MPDPLRKARGELVRVNQSAIRATRLRAPLAAELKRKVEARHPLPPPLLLREPEAFVQRG